MCDLGLPGTLNYCVRKVGVGKLDDEADPRFYHMGMTDAT